MNDRLGENSIGKLFETMDHLSPEEALQGTLHLQNQVYMGENLGNTVGLEAL